MIHFISNDLNMKYNIRYKRYIFEFVWRYHVCAIGRQVLLLWNSLFLSLSVYQSFGLVWFGRIRLVHAPSMAISPSRDWEMVAYIQMNMRFVCIKSSEKGNAITKTNVHNIWDINNVSFLAMDMVNIIEYSVACITFWQFFFFNVSSMRKSLGNLASIDIAVSDAEYRWQNFIFK